MCQNFPTHADGYYDDTGQWQRTKFCFTSCGARCTCLPPNGQSYSAAHDKRLKDAQRSALDESRVNQEMASRIEQARVDRCTCGYQCAHDGARRRSAELNIPY